MRLGRSLTAIAAAVAAAALVASGCSVSTNEEPQAAGELFTQFVQTTTSTTSSTTPPADATREADVYFLQTSDGPTIVEAVPREFEVGASMFDILDSLFTVPPDSEGDERPAEEGLSSAITDSAVLESAELASETSSELIVDTTLFDTVSGSRLREALAQIVLTATASPSVHSVSFVNDGKPESPIVAGGETVSRPVTEADYRTFLG